MATGGPLLPAGLPPGHFKPAAGMGGTTRAVKAAAVMGSPGVRTRLQFLLDIAQATFSQPGQPTAQQIAALRRTLSQVPLDELGITLSKQELDSSCSSRSASPGLSEDPSELLDRDAAARSGDAVAAAAAEADEPPRPPITYLLIYEDSKVSMGIFCLPARARIPLHNHPGMTVLSRVLYGQMHVSSYDWLEFEEGVEQPLPSEARLVLDATLGAGDPPVVLFPKAGGNIHQFTAVTDCAVLDLMSPPYSTEDGRDCEYYRVLPGPQPRLHDHPVVLLDGFEPPQDFVIEQGDYSGVMPRAKLAPISPSSSARVGGPARSTDSEGSACAERGSSPPTPSSSSRPSSPPGSPTSVTSGATERSQSGGTRKALGKAAKRASRSRESKSPGAE